MNSRSTRIYLSIASAILSVSCGSIYYWLLLKASAIGDEKAGLGNAVGAMKTEDSGFPFLILGSVFMGCFVGVLIKGPIWLKILLSILTILATFVLIFFFGFNVHASTVKY